MFEGKEKQLFRGAGSKSMMNRSKFRASAVPIKNDPKNWMHKKTSGVDKPVDTPIDDLVMQVEMNANNGPTLEIDFSASLPENQLSMGMGGSESPEHMMKF